MNIIYIVCHDLGRHLGCYGIPVQTPNLDRFAAGGVRFDRAYCNSAVCSPSRGCAMTGQYAHNNGMVGLSHFGWRIRDEVPTIVDRFNAASIETVHCGLSHEGPEGDNRYNIDHEVSWDSRHVEHSVDDAIRYLDDRDSSDERPFYLNIGTQEVHRCIWGVDNDSEGRPSRLHTKYGGSIPSGEVYLPPQVPDTPTYRDMFGRFQAAIQYMDGEMGRLFDAIERNGHRENSLIIFTTDHGPAGPRGKGTLYNWGMEIALLAQMPGGAKGATCPHLIQNIDLVPTWLEAAGLDLPEDLPGRSFLPVVRGGDYTPYTEIFTEWNYGGGYDDYSPARAILTPEYHLIRHFGETRNHSPLPEAWLGHDAPSEFSSSLEWTHSLPNDAPVELYDVIHDPEERIDLANSAEHGEIRAALAAKIDEWMEATDDYLLTNQRPKPTAKPGFNL